MPCYVVSVNGDGIVLTKFYYNLQLYIFTFMSIFVNYFKQSCLYIHKKCSHMINIQLLNDNKPLLLRISYNPFLISPLMARCLAKSCSNFWTLFFKDIWSSWDDNTVKSNPWKATQKGIKCISTLFNHKSVDSKFLMFAYQCHDKYILSFIICDTHFIYKKGQNELDI